MSYKAEFIAFMARAGVLTFGDFTTKSGRKTPYFINTGNYRTGAQIARLGEFYAACIAAHTESGELPSEVAALFGPAYKGIPLAVSTAAALARMGRDVNYCFNRKEAKDHGEGGSMVGYQPKDGDKLLIIEDVITAGTAVRETLPVLHAAARVEVPGLIISVDRMERGQGELTAIEEIERDFGIRTFPLVTVRDILETLYNKEIDGRILIDGTPVFDSEKGINLPPNKRDIGFLFQNYALWPHMTVYENIAFGLEMLKWDKARIRKRVDELLALLKIEQFEKRYPAELSGGQQQRVAIARALVTDPRILLADEPTGALDQATGRQVMALFRALNDEGRTILMITHDLSIARCARRVVHIVDGVLTEGGDARNMQSEAAS